MIKLKCVSPDM